MAVFFLALITMVFGKPAVVYDDAENIASPYFIGATSSQYIARNFNGYYVAESPYVSTFSLPLTTSNAYTSYVL
jgi:hypothetical protein